MNFMAFVGRRLTLIATVFALGGACTASEGVRLDRDGAASGNTGAAGEDPSGSGGTGAGIAEGTAGEGAASGSAGSGAGGVVGSGSAGASTGAAGAAGRGATAGAGGAQVDAGSAGASGSAGAGGDAGTQYSYANGIGTLLVFRCGGCHLGTEVQGGFSISYANVTAHVSAATSGCPGLDSSKLRVVPGKPQNSLIWIKTNINANPPGGCGGHMPNMALSLLPDQFQELQDWITQGAKP
jgi:hypothetical protein